MRLPDLAARMLVGICGGLVWVLGSLGNASLRADDHMSESRDIFTCTKDTPLTTDHPEGIRVRHVDAREVGKQRDGYPGGDWVTMRCPHCGTVWEQELPQ